jgi:hypothetical protein
MHSMHKRFFEAAGVIAMAVTFAGSSFAATTTVKATDVIYAAGSQSGIAATAGGTVPGAISLPTGAVSFTVSSVTGSTTGGSCPSAQGCITINPATSLNDAYGNGALPATSSEVGYGSISGITAPGGGYLVGVFLATGGPSGSAPPALNFVTSGTNFTSLSPVLDQVFFVGDGTTGDGSGTTQTFNVPAGASLLYLGISDACGYVGTPSCYGDNAGTFTVNYNVILTPVGTPIPSSILLTLLGLACGALFLGYSGLRLRGVQKA